jgi:hypothetical protein
MTNFEFQRYILQVYLKIKQTISPSGKSDLEGFNKIFYFQRSSSALRAPPQEEDIEIVYFTSPISFLTNGEIKIKITPATKA